jgi:hypothetical protein
MHYLWRAADHEGDVLEAAACGLIVLAVRLRLPAFPHLNGPSSHPHVLCLSDRAPERSWLMAETAKGKKYIEVQAYTYTKGDGTKVKAPRHDRSTPRTSTGKK